MRTFKFDKIPNIIYPEYVVLSDSYFKVEDLLTKSFARSNTAKGIHGRNNHLHTSNKFVDSVSFRISEYITCRFSNVIREALFISESSGLIFVDYFLPDYSVVIELDDHRKKNYFKEYCDLRDNYLKSLGITTIRIFQDQSKTSYENCVNQIDNLNLTTNKCNLIDYSGDNKNSLCVDIFDYQRYVLSTNKRMLNIDSYLHNLLTNRCNSNNFTRLSIPKIFDLSCNVDNKAVEILDKLFNISTIELTRQDKFILTNPKVNEFLGGILTDRLNRVNDPLRVPDTTYNIFGNYIYTKSNNNIYRNNYVNKVVKELKELFNIDIRVVSDLYVKFIDNPVVRKLDELNENIITKNFNSYSNNSVHISIMNDELKKISKVQNWCYDQYKRGLCRNLLNLYNVHLEIIN